MERVSATGCRSYLKQQSSASQNSIVEARAQVVLQMAKDPDLSCWLM